MTQYKIFSRFAISITWIWLALFALIPSFLLLLTSVLVQGDTELVRLRFTLGNYGRLFDSMYLYIFLRSFSLAAVCTFGCLLLAYPFSYCLARLSHRFRGVLVLLVMIPFWTSSLIRSYAIVTILKMHGLLNTFLLSLGLIDKPLQLLYTNTATVIGLIYTLLPLMILPLYASIEKLDWRLVEAARDLGANKYRVFFYILLPLTLPGVLAGCVLVLLPAMTLFYIPDLLGGAKTFLLGNAIQNQFLTARDWPMGSTISIALIFIMGLALFIYWHFYGKQLDVSHETH
ncbi:MAG: spermidine/putrescine ABC transporter permease PotB [Gammaproteobacteria bacterium]|nr:spermidine/putrescine ABC transporter permease PotB [Gammaproteobacteria bacterium]MBP9729201.1 spermidine/putrescine ABC transporter permease PotB [Gammaproteobacteria bacterium]